MDRRLTMVRLQGYAIGWVRDDFDPDEINALNEDVDRLERGLYRSDNKLHWIDCDVVQLGISRPELTLNVPGALWLLEKRWTSYNRKINC